MSKLLFFTFLFLPMFSQAQATTFKSVYCNYEVSANSVNPNRRFEEEGEMIEASAGYFFKTVNHGDIEIRLDAQGLQQKDPSVSFFVNQGTHIVYQSTARVGFKQDSIDPKYFYIMIDIEAVLVEGVTHFLQVRCDAEAE